MKWLNRIRSARARRAQRRGDEARDRRDWASAADHYGEHLRLNPDNFGIWVQRGHALKEAGQLLHAVAAYDAAFRIRQSDADLLLSLGHLHKRMGQRENALSYYRRSAEIDGNAHALRELEHLGAGPSGQTHVRPPAHREAAARRDRPGRPTAGRGPGLGIGAARIKALADAAGARGDWPEAVETYRAFLSRRPDSFDAWRRLGDALVASGSLGEALEAYERAFRLDPDHIDLLLALARLHKASGRPETAAAIVRRVTVMTASDAVLDALEEICAGLGGLDHPSVEDRPRISISGAISRDLDEVDAFEQPDIIFVMGCWEGESKRYRVYNLIEGLNEEAFSTEIVDCADLGSIILRKLKPRVAVFFRAALDQSDVTHKVLAYLRANGALVVFDIDDYVFEPAIIDRIAGVDISDPQAVKDYVAGVEGYRALLLACDRVTVTTAFLAERVRALGRDAHVVRNTLNAAQIELSEALIARKPATRDTVRICYFSGTRTHSKDFLECAAGLKSVLRKNPEVRFRLVGHLDLGPDWDEFASRIERSGFVAPLDMLASLSECDINLAPLEEGNPFCEGKSELKFFEAALVEAPTVASRTAQFAAAITDAETGFLASGAAEWEAKLQALIDSPALRKRMGAAARASALANFGVAVAVREALAAYGIEQDDMTPADRRRRPLSIGWIVPELVIGGGGHRNIIRAAYHLERLGHDVRLYFTDARMTDRELRTAVRRHFYPFRGFVGRFEGAVDGEDVLMATHWSTVGLAESVRSQVGQLIYFVQDFEPAFYPMGADYILAENTYRRGLYGISSGPWCERQLRERYGMEVDHFQFPIDRKTYNDLEPRARANRLVFFAKPEMARRCFQVGVAALRELHRLCPDLEIVFFGSALARDYPLDFPVTHAGMLPNLADLANLYATSKLGMVFSTTNPSLVPYEMMACGLPIVDLGVPGNAVNYGDRQDIAFLADPEPAVMAGQLVSLLADADQLERRGRNGVAFAAGFPTEREMAGRVERLILDRVERAGESRSERRRPASAKTDSGPASVRSTHSAVN